MEEVKSKPRPIPLTVIPMKLSVCLLMQHVYAEACFTCLDFQGAECTTPFERSELQAIALLANQQP